MPMSTVTTYIYGIFSSVSKGGQLLTVNTNNIIILQSEVDSYSYNVYQGKRTGVITTDIQETEALL